MFKLTFRDGFVHEVKPSDVLDCCGNDDSRYQDDKYLLLRDLMYNLTEYGCVIRGVGDLLTIEMAHGELVSVVKL